MIATIEEKIDIAIKQSMICQLIMSVSDLPLRTFRTSYGNKVTNRVMEDLGSISIFAPKDTVYSYGNDCVSFKVDRGIVKLWLEDDTGDSLYCVDDESAMGLQHLHRIDQLCTWLQE